MVRMLLMVVALLVIALIVMAVLRRIARAANEARADDPYRVLETVDEGAAHVLIGRGRPDGNVLIGSVPVGDPDFDERYAELIVRAEDRVATLNASRRLHQGS